MKQGQETNQIWTQEAGTDDTHNRTLTQHALQYNYLGLVLTPTGNFNLAIKTLLVKVQIEIFVMVSDLTNKALNISNPEKPGRIKEIMNE